MRIIDLLVNSTEKYSSKVAIYHDNYSLTYQELLEKVHAISLQLKESGIKEHDKIMMVFDNSPEFIITFFAINHLNAIIIPVYSNIGTSKMTEMVNYFNIDFIITHSSKIPRFMGEVVPNTPNLVGIISVNQDEVQYFKNYDRKDSRNEDVPNPAIILFSSGTTSRAKAVMLSNANIISNVFSISDYLDLTETDKILLIKNINHASSITGEMLVSIHNGCTLYTTSILSTPAAIWRILEKQKITVFFAVPALLYLMLNCNTSKNHDLSKLRIINFYGSSVSHYKIQELAKLLPKVNLIYSYGLTEAAPRVTYIYGEELLKRKNCSGVPVKNVNVFIANDYGQLIREGNIIGEIVVQGPNVMLGYYKDPELTRKVLRDGLLFTGDLGFLDSDGYLYVTGRKDNLIVQAGKNVYPEEIESVILGVLEVKEVLVCGENDEIAGEQIVAYLTPQAGVDIKKEKVLLYCNKFLEDYKVPKKIYIVSTLQKTASGKVIRKQFAGGMSK